MTSSDFTGKVVLVMGHDARLGPLIAQRLASRGAQVVLDAAPPFDGSATAEVLRAQIDRLFGAFEASHNRLDVLVNLSGVPSGTDDADERCCERTLDIRLSAALWSSRRAAALMSSVGGAIVHVSLDDVSGSPSNLLARDASAAAFEALSRYLAAAYRHRGVRVSTASAASITGADLAGLFAGLESAVGEPTAGDVATSPGSAPTRPAGSRTASLASSTPRADSRPQIGVVVSPPSRNDALSAPHCSGPFNPSVEPVADSVNQPGASVVGAEPPARRAAETAAPATATTPATPSRPEPLPISLRHPSIRADGRTLAVSRYEIEWRDAPDLGSRPGVDFLGAATLLVTDRPDRVERLTVLPPDLVVLSTAPISVPRPGWYHVPEPSESVVASLLAQQAAPLRHLRVISAFDAHLAPPDVPRPDLLLLHDLCFVALTQMHRALADEGSFVMAFADALHVGTPHPAAGLFTGLLKSASLEMPTCCVMAVLSDSSDVATALAQAERETASCGFLPVVLCAGERRLTARLARRSGDLDAAGRARVGRDSVIVAVGDARGITAELLKALASQFQPTIYLIGSHRLEEDSGECFDESDEDFLRLRNQYLREQRALDPSLPLPAINQGFDRFVETRVARRNVALMKASCGADRVHYLCADVLDESRLSEVVGQILERERVIDLLIYAAGMNRPALVPLKQLGDFTAVRDLKVRGYWNLRRAFGSLRPRQWCNFGALTGHTGQAAETDDAAANDFLNTVSGFHRSLGEDEVTMGWTRGGSIGLGADTLAPSSLEKSGLVTSMSPEDSVHLFLRELNLARRSHDCVHLGRREERALSSALPGYFDDLEADASGHLGFYLGRRCDNGPPAVASEAWFERVFDLETDAYLRHHRVHGRPTLPATFFLEIAAEAALQLHPEARVVGFESVVFHRCLQIDEHERPVAKRIHARTIESDGARSTVVASVLDADPASANPAHFEVRVLLAASHAPAPLWQPWPDGDFTSLADPYHGEASPVRLSQLFISTGDTRSTRRGRRARFALRLDPADPVFSRFVVPSLLLDGLMRAAALNVVAGEYLPVVALVTIRRIDLYESGNDLDLAARHPRLEIYVTPREFALESEGSRNRFIVARNDGRMALQVKDAASVILGYVHRGSGAFVSRAQVEAARADAI